jgi:hypothetical protein
MAHSPSLKFPKTFNLSQFAYSSRPELINLLPHTILQEIKCGQPGIKRLFIFVTLTLKELKGRGLYSSLCSDDIEAPLNNLNEKTALQTHLSS